FNLSNNVLFGKTEKMILNMRIFFAFLLILFAIYNANAFQKGENRILNSDFENDKVGEKPANWDFLSGG
ncbi:MAG: hypothetical protein ACUVWN_14540, partial [bacterium]